MSIHELRRYLEAQERVVARLMRKRTTLAAQLARLDKQIVAAGGSVKSTPAAPARGRRSAAAPGPRPRGRAAGKPLIDYIVRVLKAAPKGMRVKKVVGAVIKAGYRSNSKDFYGIVATALREGKQFKKMSRGVYARR
jgi:hypothetical protein